MTLFKIKEISPTRKLIIVFDTICKRRLSGQSSYNRLVSKGVARKQLGLVPIRLSDKQIINNIQIFAAKNEIKVIIIY